jgi:hypothetical protein
MKENIKMQSILILLLACGDKDENIPDLPTEPSVEGPSCDTEIDPDCDGFTEEEGDCDPNDGLVYPGATEIPYDGKDNDCSGDGDQNDFDGDGYIGSSAEGGDDCDDSNPDVYPGAPEICYDGIDQDCAGDVELENNNDCDGDGFIGRGSGATDCNDEDPEMNPDAEEIWYDGFDQNCDGWDDFDQDQDGDPVAEIDIDGDGVLDETWDAQGDGFLEYEGGTDCDDTDELTSPNFIERWDEVDRDCDGVFDGLVVADSYATYYSTGTAEGGVGMSMASVGDLTGDGIAEIAVGAPYSEYDAVIDENGALVRENYNGAVYILDPTNEGSAATVKVSSIVGGTYSYIGWDMVSIGDVNSGGIDDLIIGAPGVSKAYLFHGEDLANGSLALSDAHTSISGVGMAGFDVASLGDVNGDGIADVAVGGSSPYASESAWVGVWDGNLVSQGGALNYNDALFAVATDSTGTSIGGETAGGEDFDGDGLPDMVVTYDVTGTGKVAVISATEFVAGTVNAHQDYAAVSGANGSYFGQHIATAHEIDGDGYAEIVVAAPYAISTTSDGNSYDYGGVVYIINGSELVAGGNLASAPYIQIHGSAISSNLQVIDHLGDNDADGITDVVVSEVNELVSLNTPDVVTYMFQGANIQSGGTFDADQATSHIYRPTSDHDMFGYSGIATDFDNDGDDDLVIGAPRQGYVVGAGNQNFDGIFGIGNLYIFESNLP